MTTNREVRYEEIVSMRLPTSEAKRLRDAAEADDRPASTLARRLVIRGLDQLERAGSPATATVR